MPAYWNYQKLLSSTPTTVICEKITGGQKQGVVISDSACTVVIVEGLKQPKALNLELTAV
jgi:hypothetical protein